MTTQELFQAAEKEAPETMKKVAASLFLIEQLAPEFLPNVMENFEKIAARVEVLEKKAASSSRLAQAFESLKSNAGRATKQGLLAAGGAVAAGLGMAVATDLYRAARQGLTATRNWKRMLEVAPELNEFDKAKVRQSFESVQHLAPDIAADPMAASSITYRLTHAPLSDHDRILRDTIDMQKNRVQSVYSPFNQRLPSVKID